jgi:hypothetical protein
MFALCAFVLVISTNPAQADGDRTHELGKATSGEDPDARARAVYDLCLINDKVAAGYVIAALERERDGPAGFAMADAVVNLTDPEALKLASATVSKWNTPQTLTSAYWLLSGLAKQRSEAADEVLMELGATISEKEIYLGAALIEAWANAGRTDFGHVLPALLDQYTEKWDTEHWLLALTVFSACPRMTSEKENATRLKVVTALANVLEKTKDDRVRWFTCKALADVTGKPPVVQVEYWRWWVKVEGKTAEDSPEDARKTTSGPRPPAFFNAEAVGKRVVFVIDTSGSMSGGIKISDEPEAPGTKKKDDPVSGKRKGDKDKDAEKVEKPDYSKVKTKLDLAKVELIFTLKNLPEDYYFNIVVYGSTHNMIDQGKKELIQATDTNKQSFIRKVEQLDLSGATNIHGALNRAFCVNETKSLKPEDMVEGKVDPASDVNCLVSGATTIFFLTDGSPNVSDEKDTGDVIADMLSGRFTKAENIIAEVRRLNLFRRAVIHTVGIGAHPKDLLEGLAKATGGAYIDRTGEPADMED